MKTPTTKTEAMNEARQAKERAALYAAQAKKAKPETAATLRRLAATNSEQHAHFVALASTLP